MKKTIVLIEQLDDKALAADPQSKVEASNTRLIGVDGKWREIDLSDENNDLFNGQVVDEWFKVAHRLQEPHRTEPAPRPEASKWSQDPESVQYKKDLRDWADKYQVTNPLADGRIAYRTETDKYYYPLALRQAFEAFQAGAPEEEWRGIYARGVRSYNRTWSRSRKDDDDQDRSGKN